MQLVWLVKIWESQPIGFEPIRKGSALYNRAKELYLVILILKHPVIESGVNQLARE